MNGIENHAEYYRGYLPDDRSLIPVAIALATIVALWLVSTVGPQPRPETAQSAAHASTVVISQPVRRHE